MNPRYCLMRPVPGSARPVISKSLGGSVVAVNCTCGLLRRHVILCTVRPKI